MPAHRRGRLALALLYQLCRYFLPLIVGGGLVLVIAPTASADDTVVSGQPCAGGGTFPGQLAPVTGYPGSRDDQQIPTPYYDTSGALRDYVGVKAVLSVEAGSLVTSVEVTCSLVSQSGTVLAATNASAAGTTAILEGDFLLGFYLHYNDDTGKLVVKVVEEPSICTTFRWTALDGQARSKAVGCGKIRDNAGIWTGGKEWGDCYVDPTPEPQCTSYGIGIMASDGSLVLTQLGGLHVYSLPDGETDPYNNPWDFQPLGVFADAQLWSCSKVLTSLGARTAGCFPQPGIYWYCSGLVVAAATVQPGAVQGQASCYGTTGTAVNGQDAITAPVYRPPADYAVATQPASITMEATEFVCQACAINDVGTPAAQFDVFCADPVTP
jgi:hypothetical protein